MDAKSSSYGVTKSMLALFRTIAALFVCLPVAIGLVLYLYFNPASSAPTCSPASVQLQIIATERPAMGALEREFWQRAIAAAAAKHHIPADVVTAKIAQESRFNGRAVSEKGAKGAGQLMPMWIKGFDPFEIEANLDKSAEVLATELKATNGDVRRSLRRYNGGGPNGETYVSTGPYADAILARVYLAREKSCSTNQQTKEKST